MFPQSQTYPSLAPPERRLLGFTPAYLLLRFDVTLWRLFHCGLETGVCLLSIVSKRGSRISPNTSGGKRQGTSLFMRGTAVVHNHCFPFADHKESD